MIDMTAVRTRRDEFARESDGSDPWGRDGRARWPATDDEEDYVYALYTSDFVEGQQTRREALHRTWQQNILFLLGQQWLEYDSLTGTFAIPRTHAWKERPVVNLLTPFQKHFVAKVTKERPVLSAVPASTDPEDVQSALLGDDVVEAKWQEQQGSRILRRALAWVMPTGNALIMPYWNQDTGRIVPLIAPVEGHRHDEAGSPMYDPESGEPVIDMIDCPCDEDGEPRMDRFGNYDLEAEPHYVDEGDIGYKVVSPFHYYVDEAAESPEEVRELVIIDPMPMREFYRAFPDAPPGIVPDAEGGIDDFDTMLDSLATGVGGADTHFIGARSHDDVDRKVRVFHYYARPTPDFPMGRHWITAGRELIVEPQPLPEDLWPQAVFLRDIEVPGEFFAAATMTDAVGLQREYNEANAFIKEHHNLLLRGKWLVPIGSNIRRGQITSEPGEVIQHTPGLPPKQADLRPLPEAVYLERKRIIEDFQLVSGLFKISMGGSAPPGVTSGRAFLTMQEADDTDIGPFLTMLEDAHAELGMLSLRIIQKRYTDDRLIRVAGENRRYRVRAFKGSDLRGVSDVQAQRGSAFPWNRVAKQDMMLQLAKDTPQVFADPETGQFDVQRFRDALPVGGIGVVSAAGDDDIAQALREEEEFEAFVDGQVDPQALPQAEPWNNHMVHIRQHRKLLNSAAFKRWPPSNRIALIFHWNQHKTLVAQEAMAAAMLQAGPGGPGGGPPPGPPSGPPQ